MTTKFFRFGAHSARSGLITRPSTHGSLAERPPLFASVSARRAKTGSLAEGPQLPNNHDKSTGCFWWHAKRF